MEKGCDKCPDAIIKAVQSGEKVAHCSCCNSSYRKNTFTQEWDKQQYFLQQTPNGFSFGVFLLQRVQKRTHKIQKRTHSMRPLLILCPFSYLKNFSKRSSPSFKESKSLPKHILKCHLPLAPNPVPGTTANFCSFRSFIHSETSSSVYLNLGKA